MLYIKKSEFYLSSKQINLLRDGAVEGEVDVLQEVKGSKPCKVGEMLCFFVSSALTIAVKLNNFNANWCTKFAVKNKYLFTACLSVFQFFLDPGIYNCESCLGEKDYYPQITQRLIET